MNKPPWIRQHTGVVSELKVQGALDYLVEHPHPWAKARFEHTKAENQLKQIWAEVHAEQTGTVSDKENATERHQRVRDARLRVAETQYEMDSHKARIDAARSVLDIYQTESANSRHTGKLG